MDQSTQSERFTFGDVQDTQYFSFQIGGQAIQLPYNPFVFDLKIVVIRSRIGYEDVGSEIQLAREGLTVFGRRKKSAKEWSEQGSFPRYLRAQTVSQRHFSISSDYIVKDEGSKLGTFVWVDRIHPMRLQPGDEFLLGKLSLRILKTFQGGRPHLDFTYDGRSVTVKDPLRLFFIGSHRKCDLVVAGLYQFEACINLGQMHIFTDVEWDQNSADHGLWYRLKSDRPGVPVQNGSLLAIGPYVLRVTS